VSQGDAQAVLAVDQSDTLFVHLFDGECPYHAVSLLIGLSLNEYVVSFVFRKWRPMTHGITLDFLLVIRLYRLVARSVLTIILRVCARSTKYCMLNGECGRVSRVRDRKAFFFLLVALDTLSQGVPLALVTVRPVLFHRMIRKLVCVLLSHEEYLSSPCVGHCEGLLHIVVRPVATAQALLPASVVLVFLCLMRSPLVELREVVFAEKQTRQERLQSANVDLSLDGKKVEHEVALFFLQTRGVVEVPLILLSRWSFRSEKRCVRALQLPQL